MDREYDIFERVEGGRLIWRGHVSGIENAQLKLQEIAKDTTNECLAVYLATSQIVAIANTGRAEREPIRKKVVFQIAYEERLRAFRTDVLKLHGYEVVSVIGNEAAKIVLKSGQAYDLFMVGHGAPKQTRAAMTAWLKKNYPKVPILALNPPDNRELDGADYNVILNGPDTWLPFVQIAAGHPN